MKVGSTAGVISGLSPGTERLEKICRQPMFLMKLRALLLLFINGTEQNINKCRSGRPRCSSQYKSVATVLEAYTQSFKMCICFFWDTLYVWTCRLGGPCF